MELGPTLLQVHTCHYSCMTHPLQEVHPSVSVNPSVNYQPWVTATCLHGLTDYDRCTGLLGLCTVGEAGGHRDGGYTEYENSLYFLLSFAVNLKLL